MPANQPATAPPTNTAARNAHKRGCARVGCGFRGAVPVPANLNPHQVADRRQQEEIGDQAADDRDARAGQRFLLRRGRARRGRAA